MRTWKQEWFSATAARDESGGRILIADGSHFSRNLVRNYLEMAGYRVLEAANSQEALERLQRGRVDVLLSGLDLPGEGPFELLRRLRLEPEWRGLPAVALASGPEEMQQREDREFEFDDYQLRFDKEATLNSIRPAGGGWPRTATRRTKEVNKGNKDTWKTHSIPAAPERPKAIANT